MHYINYDPDKIWQLIVYTYMAHGGDLLYPGDEKEMLLRAVQSLIVQDFAIADNALLMDSLTNTMDAYMDLYGEKRSCYRMVAVPAAAKVRIDFAASGAAKTIPVGTALTADGQMTWMITQPIQQTGYAQSTEVGIVAGTAGAAGNGLAAGTSMQMCTPNPAVVSIVVTESATGGRDQEGDESYRERIREHGLVSVTTGPRQQYEQAARAASPEVLDAKAVRTAECTVCIYLILAGNADADAVQTSVLSALTGDTDRPMTDLVTVQEAEKVPYLLNVQCTVEKNLAGDVLTEAVAEYQAWQDAEIGRAFDPNRLMAALYQAGVSRVQWAEGSHINGGEVQYTTILEHQRCAGTVSLTVVS